MKRFGLAIALFCSAAAGAQTVDVGRGDWQRFPEAGRSGRLYLSNGAMDAIEALGRQQACQVPGLGRSAVDINVPFVLRFDASGRVERIVLRDLGCPALEQVLAHSLQGLASAGEFRPTRGAGWHRSTIQYANR